MGLPAFLAVPPDEAHTHLLRVAKANANCQVVELIAVEAGADPDLQQTVCRSV